MYLNTESKDDEACSIIFGNCININSQCDGEFIDVCGGSPERQCCFPLMCTLVTYENDNIKGLTPVLYPRDSG